MAFRQEEITWFQSTIDEMAKRIEDVNTTSNEAAVAYGKIARVCVRAMEVDAAQTAKRATRTNHVTKFQTARQARSQRRGGTATATQGNQGNA